MSLHHHVLAVALGAASVAALAQPWTTIAAEGEGFVVPGTTTVRYGAGNQWVSKAVSGAGECANAFFGKDPAYMVPKLCQVQEGSVPLQAGALPPSKVAPSGLELAIGSATGGRQLPFTVGQVFRRGDVPRGKLVRSAEVPALQCVVKNRWPDGSAKFAVLSGHIDLKGNEWRRVPLEPAEQAAVEPPIPASAVRAAAGTVSIAFAPFGTATWTGPDWDRPVRTWIAGPEMSSYLFRKPIGSDPHLVGWLETRVYRNGPVEVLAWIENGYLNAPGPTEKAGQVTLTIAGSTRYAQPMRLLNHQRAVVAEGESQTHWIGVDPHVNVRHATDYFMATRLVPNYRGITSPLSSLYSRLATSYVPLAQANFSPDMPKPGYEPGIGLLPEWDAAYLTTAGDPRAWRAVVVNGLAAGRYGIHYRDETTNRLPLFAAYPTLVLNRNGAGVKDVGSSSANRTTPANSGTPPPLYDLPHHPSMGYMAYLLTGWSYFMEEVQFLATTNHFKQNDTTRQQARGILETTSGTNTVRGVGWAIRTLAQAATVTPDDDAVLRGQFVGSLSENVAYYHRRYVLTRNNPLGLVQPYSNYNEGDPLTHATWMDDFVSAAFGYLKDLDLLGPEPAQKLDQFLSWKYRAVVGRLGSGAPGTFNYRFAAPYTMNYAPSANADFTEGRGPWYANWGEVAVAMRIPPDDGSTALQGSSGSDPANMATGFWGNLLAALAYAVDHEAPGAAAAYERLIGASNFAAAAARFDDMPVWGLRPRKTSTAR